MTEFDQQRNLTFRDAFNFLCGNHLGRGQFRDVFICRFDNSLVVKVEIEDDAGWRSFHNVNEANFWNSYEDRRTVSKWLAPVVYRSPDMRLIAQKRVKHIPNDRLPKKLPEFFIDIKKENFGMLEGRVVCCDYAITLPIIETKLKRVEWT